MSNYIQKLSDYTIKGLEEFSKDPINHTVKALEDYWDAGAAVLSGYAFTDYHNETLGILRWPVFIGGLVGGIYGGQKDYDRMYRNAGLGIASLAFFWTKGIKDNLDLSIATKIAGITIGGWSEYFFDNNAIGKNLRKLIHSRKQETNGSLDDFIK